MKKLILAALAFFITTGFTSCELRDPAFTDGCGKYEYEAQSGYLATRGELKITKIKSSDGYIASYNIKTGQFNCTPVEEY